MRLTSTLILFTSLILMSTSPSFAAVQNTPVVGNVKYLIGSAVAVRGLNTVILKRGDKLYEGDLLKTGKRSSLYAAMLGDKDNSIRLGQRSQLKVKSYKVAKSGSVVGGFLRGLIGIFSVELNNLRKGSSFSMHTPTAVLGVRGTVWGSVVKADGSTTFAVKRGSISVRMGGKSVLLKKGQMVSVSKAGVVSPVQPTPKSLQDSLDSDGTSFDNVAAEAAALAAAEKEANEAAEALAEAEKAKKEAAEAEAEALAEVEKQAKEAKEAQEALAEAEKAVKEADDAQALAEAEKAVKEAAKSLKEAADAEALAKVEKAEKEAASAIAEAALLTAETVVETTEKTVGEAQVAVATAEAAVPVVIAGIPAPQTPAAQSADPTVGLDPSASIQPIVAPPTATKPSPASSGGGTPASGS
ncbi:MAG: FecR domain-containing protein [Ghiorsea sp.]